MECPRWRGEAKIVGGERRGGVEARRIRIAERGVG